VVFVLPCLDGRSLAVGTGFRSPAWYLGSRHGIVHAINDKLGIEPYGGAGLSNLPATFQASDAKAQKSRIRSLPTRLFRTYSLQIPRPTYQA
jgi:hypothetical protein